MKLHDWKEKGDYFVSSKGYKLFVREAGSGPLLILIHGFPTASWDWYRVWDQLTSHFHVLTLDMLGFGYSDKPKRYPYSILEQADLIEELLQHRSLKSGHLLAHDYGDTVAQEMVARQLDGTLSFSIESVCLLNGGIFPEAHKARVIQHLLRSRIGFLLTPFLNRSSLSRNFKAIFGKTTQPSEEEIDEFYSLVEYNGGRYVLPLLIRYMDERVAHRERWVNALRVCPCPLRLINGVDDPISGQQMVDRFREVVSNADVVEIQGIGHYPQVEAPGSVLKDFLEWNPVTA